jgi:hypothetical protein
MNALFEPARAGFVVLACLVAACSGATEPGSDGSSQTGGESRTVAAPSPATSSDSTGASGGSSAPSGSSAPASGGAAEPAPAPSGGSGGAASGVAVCGPDELCHGISSCTNSCYGPTCCSASCYCTDVYKESSHLVCSLSCSK